MESPRRRAECLRRWLRATPASRRTAGDLAWCHASLRSIECTLANREGATDAWWTRLLRDVGVALWCDSYHRRRTMRWLEAPDAEVDSCYERLARAAGLDGWEEIDALQLGALGD